ncbi:MAG: flagellar biosynthetic protein FliR [bacterium]
MDSASLFTIPQLMLERLDVGWTFLLLLTRYTIFMMLAPGLGGGMTGITVRYPAAVVLALASLNPAQAVAVPIDMGLLAAQLISEVLLGTVVALIPLTIVAGAQTAGHLASSTMGLNAAQLIDPTTSVALPDLARIYSDLSIVVFLLVGGHYLVISELAGLEQTIRPGSFILSASGLETLISQSARIFQIGCLIAAPVIVALLLTNFVMGLISKAVPTINIFIISFPLTIAIGLMISMIALPEVIHFMGQEFTRLEGVLSQALH